MTEMNHPTMPALPPSVPEPEGTLSPKARRIAMSCIGTALLGVVFTTGFFVGRDSVDEPAPRAPKVASGTAMDDGVPGEEAVFSSPEPEDFAIDLKVKAKQCYGSAGCNVTVEPVLTYPEGLDPEALYEVTYTITGGEDGSVIETAELMGENAQGQETLISTSSSAVTPKAKVTDVSVR